MALSDRIVTETHTDVTHLVDLINQAKALAAEITAKHTALGGASTAVSDYSWPEGYTENDYANMVSTMASHVPTVLTNGHDTNVFKFLLAMG